MAIDYARAMTAYKVGAQGGDAGCQYQVGRLYYDGDAVDANHAQALLWLEKAAAQDQPDAVGELGFMYARGDGVTPSWRRARQYMERSVKLRCFKSETNLQNLTGDIQHVMPSIHSTC